MPYEVGNVYHIYNQGNNKERIFFQERNYIYFIQKMRQYILPQADFLAYCLMPNHFHWLVKIKLMDCESSKRVKPISNQNLDERHLKDTSHLNKMQNMSAAIGTLLSSYTKAVN